MSDYLKRKRDLPLWRQLQDRCEHFNGLVNAVCRAGVTYTDVRVGSTRPLRLSLPRERGASAGHDDM